jgi:prepilin-type N-terminal cleavage/methylation domain-containing protein
MPEMTKGSMDKGFTIIEVLGAVVILGIVIVAFMGLSGNWALHESKSAIEREAVEIAEEYLRNVQKDPGSCAESNWEKIDDRYIVQCRKDLLNDLVNDGVSQYSTAIGGPKHVSLQTVFLEGNDLKVATVTVSWGNG